MSSIYDWSLIADANGNSDNIINWEEGQPPSSVNGSARGMMQRIAEYINDLSGNAFVIGDGNKVTVNITSKLSSYKDGVRFYFRPNITNSKEMQLRIGNLAFLPVYQADQSGLKLLEANSCQAGGLYEVIYSSHLGEDQKGGWFLTNPSRSAKSSKIPAGVIVSYSSPHYKKYDWLICDGSAVKKSEYKDLYDAIGDIWGKTNKGPDYFLLPDLRGTFLRGLDSGRGLDKGREFASLQLSDIKSHTHKIECEEDGEHSHRTLSRRDEGPYLDQSLFPAYVKKWANYIDITPPPIEPGGKHKHEIVVEKEGGPESRPCNYSVLFLIKT